VVVGMFWVGARVLFLVRWLLGCSRWLLGCSRCDLGGCYGVAVVFWVVVVVRVF